MATKTLDKKIAKAEQGDSKMPDKAAEAERLLKAAPESPTPVKVRPMKATLVDEPFDDPGWVYEIKWDGYRAIARTTNDEATLISRNNLLFDQFYPINDLLKKWGHSAVLDGELLVLNDKGISDFSGIQNWRSEADGDLVYYVFDVLWYEGKNLMDFPLKERQAILSHILPKNDDRIRQSTVFEARGIEFFDAAERMGLEGIIAKKASSVYTSDLRSKEWLKIKVQRRQEVVIGGFTKNEGTSKPFSALTIGVYKNGVFKYMGKVGTGWGDKLQKELMEKFKPLIIDECPFEVEPDVDEPSRFRPKRLGAKPTWLKPELVCEINFAELTSDGKVRQASFKGLRTDKDAEDVVLETPSDVTETVHATDKQTDKAFHPPVEPAKQVRRTLLNPKEETQERPVNGHMLKFNHLSKVYWPEDGVTKRDMFNYYYQVAPYMVPYIKDRPMSLNRFPNGIHGPSFYQKNVADKAPEWAQTMPHVTGEGEQKEYLVGSEEDSLLWMATLGYRDEPLVQQGTITG
jgi:bifunctional non-homologous end joining protein LigD